ncbi:Zn-ribbon domain-containing OB-fold protein [Halopiger aswanensis]|uniref:ChsH2 C-terminal OB-fold domain-containing protein n=1 Tax=Halopiger aswanensis TaxID=148449 RepID=A0A419W1D7_9EURY|nr:OB-fold domain-containing protein [Halopiger aswanensis]RKD89307.1 hypothetical protein ATJ93_4140 [Halopiger aswanensis]
MSDDLESTGIGYDDWLDALEDGNGFYLQGKNTATIPPAPERESLDREPLPDEGTIEAVSTIHVPHPAFADDAPYAVAVASFGPVRLTGQVQDVDPTTVEGGSTVVPTVVSTNDTKDEERFIGFIPIESNEPEDGSKHGRPTR